MNDLDNLRREVREAINRTDMTIEMFDTLVTVNRDDYDLIRTELLRLADGNAHMRGIIETLDMAGQRRADRAEAELAESRETIKRLNRRAQVAEAGVVEKVKEHAGRAELRRLAGERDELRTAYTSASQSRDYWKECAGRAVAPAQRRLFG